MPASEKKTLVCQLGDDDRQKSSPRPPHELHPKWILLMRVIVLLITICYAWTHWDESDEPTTITTSRLLTRRVIIVCLIIIQVSYILRIKLSPIMATIGVMLAGLGFALQGPIQDYIGGLVLTYEKNVMVDDRVIMLIYGASTMQGPYTVLNMRPTVMEVIDDQSNHVFIRYNMIYVVKRLEEPLTADPFT